MVQTRYPSAMTAPEFDLPHALESIQAGDPETLSILVERYYPRVQRMVHRQLDADFRRKHRWILGAFSTGDITHEVFLQVLKSLRDVRCRDEAAFVSFLSTMVQRRLVDALRHHEAGQRDARRAARQAVDAAPMEFVADAPAPPHEATVREQDRILRQVLDAFPHKHQMLLRLRLEEGLGYADVARELGYASADAARKTFYQVHARLLVRLRAAGVAMTTLSPR